MVSHTTLTDIQRLLAADALIFIRDFLDTGDADSLVKARRQLPYCQTEEELAQLQSVIDCSQWTGGICPSTCGVPGAAPTILSIFSTFCTILILNLVLAVLMNQLQEENTREARRKGKQDKISLAVLMNVQMATNMWLSKTVVVEDDDEEEDSPQDGGEAPVAANPSDRGTGHILLS